MAVTIMGRDEPCGTYLLRIQATQDLNIRFGRYRGGMPVPVRRGELIYVGSAMARKGSMTLTHRLLRHVTRRPPLAPHKLRRTLFHVLISEGLASEEIRPPKQKKLFWNIDFLLNKESVHLVQVFILRTPFPLEDDVASMIAEDPASSVIASGLGAHDRPGDTHLFRIQADRFWWEALPARLTDLLETIKD